MQNQTKEDRLQERITTISNERDKLKEDLDKLNEKCHRLEEENNTYKVQITSIHESVQSPEYIPNRVEYLRSLMFVLLLYCSRLMNQVITEDNLVEYWKDTETGKNLADCWVKSSEDGKFNSQIKSLAQEIMSKWPSAKKRTPPISFYWNIVGFLTWFSRCLCQLQLRFWKLDNEFRKKFLNERAKKTYDEVERLKKERAEMRKEELNRVKGEMDKLTRNNGKLIWAVSIESVILILILAAFCVWKFHVWQFIF